MLHSFELISFKFFGAEAHIIHVFPTWREIKTIFYLNFMRISCFLL
jgi:hypothetical protein